MTPSSLRRMTIGGTTLAALLVVVPSAALSAPADNAITIDLSESGYTVADQSPTGQNGWTSTWYAGHWFDWAVVDNSTFPSSGLGSDGRALRHSNALDNLSQWQNVQQLVSPQLGIAAGDGASYNDIFDATFTVASATGALQDNLASSVYMDNGTGGRGGNGVILLHTATGLQLVAAWIPPTEVGADNANWRTFATAEFDATVPHTIRMVAQYVPGDHTVGPDTFKVYLDGELVIDGYTFEGYHDAVSAAESVRIADALMWRASVISPQPEGTSVGIPVSAALTSPENAALDGKGFLYTGINYATYKSTPPPPTPAPSPSPASGGADAEADGSVPGGQASFTGEGFDPYENVAVTIYSTPYFAGWFRANANGVVSGSFTLPPSFAPGSHTLQLVGQNLPQKVALSSFRVGLPETGADFSWPVLFVGGGLLGVGALLFALRARTLRSRRH